jgi:WD40 repeat protein
MNAIVRSLKIQPDGKIILGGDFTAFSSTTTTTYIARLNSNGTIDNVFRVNSSPWANNPVYTVALQPDGKIIIGGNFTTYKSNSRVRVARIGNDATY